MKNTAYAKYYEKNRAVLTEKMREREANRRAERKKEYESNPAAQTEDRALYRKKYATNRANKVKAMLETLRPHPLAETLLSTEAYRTLTPRAVSKLLLGGSFNAESGRLHPATQIDQTPPKEGPAQV